MVVKLVEPNHKNQSEKPPLLMDQSGTLIQSEHVIDIARSNQVPISGSAHNGISDDVDLLQQYDRPFGYMRTSVSQFPLPVPNNPNSRNTSHSARGSQGNSHMRRRRSPLNSGFWISFELALILGQIIASIVVLCFSKQEHPRAPLFAWIVGYAAGCVGTLPLIYWRFLHRNQVSEPDSTPSRQTSSVGNATGGSYYHFSSQVIDGNDGRTAASSNGNTNIQNVGIRNPRLKALVEYFKMVLDCYFAVWFVVGNVWIFGGHTSASEAPHVYRLCVVFLVFSCIGYAMPFILCMTICCCLPCIVSWFGYREDLNQTRGATSESINALPTYKFKVKKSRNANSTAAGKFGYVAVRTEKARAISGEDAVCCICLVKYANNDELRELPCTHLFHKDCVDKWLKINALCPLCKSEVGVTILSSLAGASAG